ncbi:MAG: tol-pal system-associated acyl-CoA thioesterase [Ferrovum sp. 37-45-19]|uniref:tol-pal system-associated acyl-CoA thioesterase n=1 Tax=Ferrovum sp. JA12 TaxID=1356299 RepID=UPI0007038E4D|nr:tol-pal system-associated acyl-CoA thioesterase [Ferrovum sp. JA12]OYV80110.1 MAG: tol-pal system-associated acyl-CoA thioesterase [Ferrovum sp. 21-44-67]OYV93329.1 MAG: tol-pal system-associated acyl-CoA thioesterase [Ferrovum sp. 37-45-19]OZB33534.1 MAG: tol-pal system-associated acyl-CoA thioesterase [Ferrovum sp. 34-44-207]HQT82349.1 tol-pal system-associated acyl-CoA thioesterase [Ferrovaceae bacterium]KRH77996.1 acyl-CoA thioesterase YbgC [Ferrovum sp. JA12]
MTTAHQEALLTSLACRVYYEDTDAGGVVYHANYLRFMERARSEWLRERGFDPHQLKESYQLLFVVRSIEIKYLAPALLGDLLTVSAQLLSLERGLLTFDQRVWRQEQELSRALIRVVSVSTETFKSINVPNSMKQALGVIW